MLGAPPARPEVQAPPGGWHATDGARLRRAEGRRSVLARGFALASRVFTRGRTYEVFGVLARSPRMFRPFIAFNARMMPFGTLDRADTERVILRTAWRTRSEYEWRQHCAIGQDVGLSPDEIRAIGQPELGHGLSARALTLLTAVDELLDDHAIGAESFTRLRAVLDDAQVIELCLLTGNYAMLAGALNTYAVPIEPALAG